MSFLEILLAQKGVVLLIILAVLMLIAGVAFATLPGIVRVMRKSTTARAARKLVQQRALVARLAAEAAVDPAASSSDEALSTVTLPDASATGAPTTPSPEQPVVVQPVVVSPTTAPAASTTKPETQTTPGSEKHGSNAMQDILGGVFADEEANAQLAILMHSLEPVNINDLNELSRSIASQLAELHTNKN